MNLQEKIKILEEMIKEKQREKEEKIYEDVKLFMYAEDTSEHTRFDK